MYVVVIEMITQTQSQKGKLIQEVWGECCLECDCTETPKFHLYSLKKEDVAVLTCPFCDFTIVVVEIERLTKSDLEDQINENKKTIVATHSTL